MKGREEQFYYLDTNYLINYLSLKHDLIAKSMSIDRDARTIANSVIKSISQKIKIPFIVISEVTGKLIEYETALRRRLLVSMNLTAILCGNRYSF
ncbi:MAG: hypothetical protein QXM43_00915 [Desulfurococcaceae archaeon]